MSPSVENERELINEIQSSRVMFWNYRKYESLPSSLLSHGQHVTDLYIKSNNLISLPVWIDRLTNLTELYLGCNRLTELPDKLGNLVNLKVLHANENSLSRVPESVAQLRNLNDVNFEGNRLKVFPSGLRKLKALYIVNLRRNHIFEVPEWLDEMASLQELILDYNFLASLPLNIVYLKSLTYLSVSSNRLLYLTFLPFHNEVTLEFWGNPTLNYIWSRFIDNNSNCVQWMGSPKNLRVKTPEHVPNSCEKIRNLRLRILELQEIITLPIQIKLLSSTRDLRQPSSLFELSMRRAYRLMFNVDEFGGRRCVSKNLGNDLTGHVVNCLNLGPFARCEICDAELFTEARVEFRTADLKMNGVDVSYLTVWFYCLSKCFVGDSSDSLEWILQDGQ